MLLKRTSFRKPRKMLHARVTNGFSGNPLLKARYVPCLPFTSVSRSRY